MTDPRLPLPDLPVEDALRRILRRRASAALRALARAADAGDPRGLHACRVSIRRLRTLLRAYRPWLGRAAGAKLRRRLRALTRGTNAARDADMLLAWLDGEAKSLDREDRAGLAWLRARLRRRRRGSGDPAGAAFERDLARAISVLRRRLRTLEVSGDTPFRAAVVEVVAPLADRLHARLGAIAGPGDLAALHRARIMAKRVRYLVEPLRHLSEEARLADKRLRKLQDVLGELHDLQTIETELAAALEDAASETARRLHGLAVEGDSRRLAQARRRDERLGLATLAGRARRLRDARYGKFERKWLPGRIDALDRELRALFECLAGEPPPGNQAP